MSEARFLVGDVFDRMAELEDASVDLIVTSPPFLALRSYLPADHPDKHKEIGSEPTPAAFLSTLLALTREWRRILTPAGSLCVELGDTYAGSSGQIVGDGAGSPGSGSGHKSPPPERPLSASVRPSPTSRRLHPDMDGRHANSDPDRREHRYNRNDNGGKGWPLDKSLCLIPSLFAGSLAYGRNLLNPDDQLEPWRVRNLIVWHRPNPPVGALGDKVRPSTSYVTVACTAKDRWFDLDSERTAFVSGNNGGGSGHTDNGTGGAGSRRIPDRKMTHAGAPPLDCWTDIPEQDVWTIPTAPYAGSHYATFPPALPRRLINLMCPRQVCTICGEPRRRIVEQTEEYAEFRAAKNAIGKSEAGARGEAGMNGGGWSNIDDSAARGTKTETLGWTDCECSGRPCDCDGDADNGHRYWCACRSESKYRRGIVLDPFAGSGTTLQAASELGRDSIGIDLDTRNLSLARQRLGMFLVEEDEVPA